ncbi:MAG: mercury methylation corrinoid protein HgcA [Deltaproteobacteria bacterium]
MSENKECCCGPAAKKDIKYRLSPGPVGTKWSLSDHLGEIKVRLGFDRMNYAVAPGIYSVGKPGRQSPVLVSANYKLSFDVLRRELEGLDVWILVLDTKGVNVWCAAGKGTFGSMEIVRRVTETGLEKLVDTRQLIVPQLGAPGISAHMVQAFCGFSVVYGPVRASDIKKFLAQGMEADPQMRRVYFNLCDRLTVSWLELAHAFEPAVLVTLLLVFFAVLRMKIFVLNRTSAELSMLPFLFWGAVVSGTVLHAVLLPYLPGRAFSFKGGVLGAVVCAAMIYLFGQPLTLATWIALVLMAGGVSAFLALNFTGASTFTSLSGVKKEIRYSMPLIIGAISIGALIEIADIVRRFL